MNRHEMIPSWPWLHSAQWLPRGCSVGGSRHGHATTTSSSFLNMFVSSPCRCLGCCFRPRPGFTRTTSNSGRIGPFTGLAFGLVLARPSDSSVISMCSRHHVYVTRRFPEIHPHPRVRTPGRPPHKSWRRCHTTGASCRPARRSSRACFSPRRPPPGSRSASALLLLVH